MVNIKYKTWELKDDFTVQDLIDMSPDLDKETMIEFVKRAIKVLESHRVKGPEIKTNILIKDFAKIQKKLGESINKAFL